MTPPRPSEEIDVEKEAEILLGIKYFPVWHTFCRDQKLVGKIIALCARIRAEAEAAAVKREWEKTKELLNAARWALQCDILAGQKEEEIYGAEPSPRNLDFIGTAEYQNREKAMGTLSLAVRRIFAAYESTAEGEKP